MRVTKKISAWFAALMCMGILYVAYAGTGLLSVHDPYPFLPEMPGPDSPALKYPITDRTGDFVSDQQTNPFYLKDPPAIQEDVEYDPTTGMYVVTEKVGGQDIKPPMYMTYDDYLKYTEQQEMNDYWKDRANAVNLVEEKSLVPPVQIKNQMLDRLFGGSKIEIKPQGNVEMTLGANVQETANPNIPIRNRKTGGFNFDMNINMNVVGKIGDKLQLGIKYNTQSGFAFDNTVKIGYTGGPDDIIKSIELGNVSMPLPTRLITGSQQLFGAKTTLQFGRLTWTTVVSQQQSKKQTITLQNGAQQQNFSITSDAYDENKNFFLAQYFYNTYDQSMTQLPNINSVVNVVRLEVWVTNRTSATQNVRYVAGFMDLGEHSPYEPTIQATGSKGLPSNNANNLYSKLTASPGTRLISNFVQNVIGPPLSLQQGQDFEMTYARKLNPNEYTFNPQLGYISLNAQTNPNDVIAVAYQYIYNGVTYQVGDFSDDVPPDSNASASKLLFVKLLKGTAPRVNLPIWNLMMKNIYSLGAFNISNQNFFLDIYYNDPATGLKRYMPVGQLKAPNQACAEGVPLLRVLNLDNLDLNNDPIPDGLFDWIQGVTIIPQTGKLIFPVLQPFGKDLAKAYDACNESSLVSTYAYQQLYDSTKYVAQQFPEFNRFVIKGTYKSSGNGSQISLGAGNIPRGSVTVTAGGQKLVEGVDYTVDYNLGRVTILNQSVLNSSQPVQIQFENNNQFQNTTQSMYGTRMDYKISNKFNIGATLVTLAEKPFTQKVQIGQEPIHNTIMGTDIKYETNLPWLTKAISKLYTTKEMSILSTYGEWAYLQPGHSRAINDPNHQPQVYIDDFEGTSSGYDLKTPPIAWKLASTPRNSPNASGQIMFPEANLINDERYGYNRALLSWYRIDNSFFTQQTSPPAVYSNPHEWQNHWVRLIPFQEVFPNAPNQTLDQNLYSFDLSYYPNQRGPYNYETTGSRDPNTGQVLSYGTRADGTLNEPQTRWAGIMRAMDNTDFVSTNVQYIEFWLMDPFVYQHTESVGGHLYIDLGNVSEDILYDSRQAFENGLTADPQNTEDEVYWGFVPKLPPLVNAFDDDPTLRPIQDVGLDGMGDAEEKVRKATFLNKINQVITQPVDIAGATSLNRIQADPSGDDYLYFEDHYWDSIYIYGQTGDKSILDRYKYFQGTEGNSPIQTNSVATTAETSLPDKEDVNNDNTMNQDEEYFQYDVRLFPGMSVANDPYIVTTLPGANDDQGNPVTWYQFRVPIESYQSKVGSISDFTSIQFMRMFLAGWDADGKQDTVVLRFGTLQLTRNQWRTYDLDLSDGCAGTSPHAGPAAFFNVGSVGLEANGSKAPVNYVLPPGILRQQALGAQTNQLVAQDEQSLYTQVGNLPDCGRKAVFRNINLDLRNYDRLEMFVHANRIVGEPTVRDSEVTAFIRIGSDFVDNYYEYEVPLIITPDGVYNTNVNSDQLAVWPAANNFTINLQDFVNLKIYRDTVGHGAFPVNVPYSRHDAQGNVITIKGNPDIGGVKTVMLGIHNPQKGDPNDPLKGNRDDGQPKYVEVWFDELRVNGFNQKGGAAALATANLKVADLGNIGVAGNMHTAGFGQVDQQLDQRFRDNLYAYNVTTAFELGKFFPTALGIRIPFYANFAQSLSTPQYDPYQFDIKSNVAVGLIRYLYGADSARAYQQEIKTINTNKGFNFTNVRIVPKTKAKRPHIYDPGNFNFTYSYNDIAFSDPFTYVNSRKTWTGILGWSFAPKSLDLLPFKKLIKSKSKWLDIVRDLGWNPYPSTMAFNSNMNRTLNTISLRPLGDVGDAIPTLYSSQFMWLRTYTFKYNPFKSLSIDYTATNRAVIDQPTGLLNTEHDRDSVWQNIIFRGGRNVAFNQSLAANYNVPINKLPAFDFITANVGYNATYAWTALPPVLGTLPNGNEGIVPNGLGNIINNTQAEKAKAELNFKKLYDHSPFLKTYDSPNPAAGDKKENDKKRDATRKARDKIKQEIAKLNDKESQLKEDLKKARALEKDTAYKNKRIAEIWRIRQLIKANRKAIRHKKTELMRKVVKQARAPVKKELVALKKERTKLRLDLLRARLGQIGKIKKDIVATKKAIRQKHIDFREKQYPSDPYASIIMRPLLMLKKVGATFTQTEATMLPGFEGYSRLFGEDYSMANAPGWGFVFGGQPGGQFLGGFNSTERTAWLNRAAANNWITTDTLLNQPFTQNFSQRWDATASLEPWPDFKIDLTIFHDYTDNYSEFFKYIADSANGYNYSFEHLTPMDVGSYTISYLPIRTFFEKFDTSGYTANYNNFIKDRAIISQRLGKINPNSVHSAHYYDPADSLPNAAFSDGYGPLSQDVLIPAFLAAYTKSNPNKISLTPFDAVPRPNWRISYNGLTKFKWAQKYFSNITISHAYNSTLTVSSYQTNLSYTNNQGSSTGYFSSNTKDPLSGNFYSLYNMPSIVINEAFAPLIGVDMTMKNNVTAKFDFKMARTLTLSFADFQEIETSSKQITVGAGYKVKGLKLPFKLPNGKKIRLNNELAFRFDFSYRDNTTVNYLIDQGDPQITAGTTAISIQPSVDYIVNKQLTVKLFYDEQHTIPKISTSYPTTNIKAGITLRFSLAQ